MPTKLQVIPEPLKHWQSIADSNGQNILGAFGQDKQKWAALFQVFAFVTRLEVLQKAYSTQRLEFVWLHVVYLAIYLGVTAACNDWTCMAATSLLYLGCVHRFKWHLCVPRYVVWLTERSVHSDMNIFAKVRGAKPPF